MYPQTHGAGELNMSWSLKLSSDVCAFSLQAHGKFVSSCLRTAITGLVSLVTSLE